MHFEQLWKILAAMHIVQYNAIELLKLKTNPEKGQVNVTCCCELWSKIKTRYSITTRIN